MLYLDTETVEIVSTASSAAFTCRTGIVYYNNRHTLWFHVGETIEWLELNLLYDRIDIRQQTA